MPCSITNPKKLALCPKNWQFFHLKRASYFEPISNARLNFRIPSSKLWYYNIAHLNSNHTVFNEVPEHEAYESAYILHRPNGTNLNLYWTSGVTNAVYFLDSASIGTGNPSV